MNLLFWWILLFAWAFAFFANHLFCTKQQVGVHAGAHVEGHPTAQLGAAGGGGGGAIGTGT